MKGRGKRGLSPIVSTVILVVIVFVLALIILLWARGFVKEAVIKSIAGNEKRADEYCLEVRIRGFVNEDNTFGFENTGNVPIFAYRLKLEGAGGSDVFKIDNNNGGSVNPGYSTIIDDYAYDSYDSITVIPILLGKVQGAAQEFECPERTGVQI